MTFWLMRDVIFFGILYSSSRFHVCFFFFCQFFFWLLIHLIAILIAYWCYWSVIRSLDNITWWHVLQQVLIKTCSKECAVFFWAFYVCFFFFFLKKHQLQKDMKMQKLESHVVFTFVHIWARYLCFWGDNRHR